MEMTKRERSKQSAITRIKEREKVTVVWNGLGDEVIRNLDRGIPNKPTLLSNGRIIIDEKCTCGELQSKHGGLLRCGGTIDETCERFTFKAWVYSDGTESDQ